MRTTLLFESSDTQRAKVANTVSRNHTIILCGLLERGKRSSASRLGNFCSPSLLFAELSPLESEMHVIIMSVVEHTLGVIQTYCTGADAA